MHCHSELIKLDCNKNSSIYQAGRVIVTRPTSWRLLSVACKYITSAEMISEVKLINAALSLLCGEKPTCCCEHKQADQTVQYQYPSAHLCSSSYTWLIKAEWGPVIFKKGLNHSDDSNSALIGKQQSRREMWQQYTFSDANSHTKRRRSISRSVHTAIFQRRSIYNVDRVWPRSQPSQ